MKETDCVLGEEEVGLEAGRILNSIRGFCACDQRSSLCVYDKLNLQGC